MIPDNGQHVIYHDGKHDTALYACTVENALALVNEAMEYQPELEAIYQRAEAKGQAALRAQSWLVDALVEILNKQPGEALPKLRTVLHGPKPREGEDLRPEVLLTAAWQQELVLWCFERQLATKELSRVSLKTLTAATPFETLSFLSPVKQRLPQGVELTESDYLDAVSELKVLRRNAWKEEAVEARVVGRYVSFLNAWGQGRWAVLSICTKV
jgi:hypothetical protein